MKKALFIFLLFVCVQFVFSTIGMVVVNIPLLQAGKPFDPYLLLTGPHIMTYIIILLIGYVLLALILWGAKLVRRRIIPTQQLRYGKRHIWKGVGWLILALPFLAMGVSILCYMLGLQDVNETLFTAIMTQPLGILTIVVIGPIVEEIVFREGVLRHMVIQGHKPWLSVLVSSILFGVIHLNPIQIFASTLIGAFLGVIYIRTGDIRISALLHILNNGLSVVLSLYVPQTLLDRFQTYVNTYLPMTDLMTETLMTAGAALLLLTLSLVWILLWSRTATPYKGKAYFESLHA